jgi:hypothetical protein
MLSRRLEGVLRQYGPDVAFFTTEIVIGRSRYVSWYGGSLPHGMDLAMIEIAAGGQLIGLSGWHAPDAELSKVRESFLRYVEEHLARGTWHARWSAAPLLPYGQGALLGAMPDFGTDLVARRELAHHIQAGIPGELTPGVLHQTSPVLSIIPWLARTVHHWLAARPHALPQGLTPRERYVSATRLRAYYKSSRSPTGPACAAPRT